MAVGIETERKFIICTPEFSLLAQQQGYGRSEIVQTYFDTAAGITHRVRKRTGMNGTRYTETKKTRISRMSVIEDEVELCEQEYLDRLSTLRIVGEPLHKTRHIFSYGGRVFEVDIYPGWQKHAVMEVEFSDEGESIELPPFIEIVKDVTGVRAYSNYAMAIAFPEEDF